MTTSVFGLSASSLGAAAPYVVPAVVVLALCAALIPLAWRYFAAKSTAAETDKPTSTAAGAGGATDRSKSGGLLVGIEGNISSGKSTVCARLQNGVCGATGQPMRVMFEQISPLLLKLFYGASSRYAFTLQLTTLQKRIDNIWRMRAQCDGEASIGLLDRSTMGDLIFATKQYLDNNIDEHETAVYVEEWVRCVLHANYFVDQVLYLHSTPELCRSRVAQRGNVDKDVKHDYLNDIGDLHVYGLWWLMLTYPNARKCFVADWRKFGVAGDLISSLFRRDPCVMSWDTTSGPNGVDAKHDSPSSASAGATRTVSRLEAKDLEYYAENLAAVKQLNATVMVPFDTHLQPLADGCLPKLAAAMRYVHSQAFKNCVMSCLSEGKRVVFYLSKPTEPRPSCMLDFFASLPARLATVESLVPVHARVADTKEKRSGEHSPERTHCPESPAAAQTVKVTRTGSPNRQADSPTRRKLSVSVDAETHQKDK